MPDTIPWVATLEHVTGGGSILLAPLYVIGRAPSCHLRLDDPSVSGLHAEISWDGQQWRLRDLDSRNGTFVREPESPPQRLERGQPIVLRPGLELGFGASPTILRVCELSPPCLFASSGAGEHRVACDEILSLPSEDEPELVIFRDVDGGWLLEHEGEQRSVGSGEVVRAGGREWRLSMPSVIDATREVDDRPALQTHELRFHVSRDGEHIELALVRGAVSIAVESRAHLELLLALARLRASDAGDGQLPSSEHGWVDRDELARMLSVDRTMINLWIHRARRQLAELGVQGAALVVERRAAGTQLRIGAPHLRVDHA